MSEIWRASPEWKGQTCFIIGGGASVASQHIERLRDCNVIVINTSYVVAPWAQFLIFSDSRWWDLHKKNLATFKGRIICTSSTIKGPPRLFRMQRKSPPGLAKDAGTVSIRFTTLTAALNLAMHLGVSKIVLLGIDGKAAPDGKTHHHPPHPWRVVKDCWKKQRQDVVKVADELKSMGIECVNASPDSAWDLWPIVKLEDCLCACPSLSADTLASAITCSSAPLSGNSSAEASTVQSG